MNDPGLIVPVSKQSVPVTIDQGVHQDPTLQSLLGDTENCLG